MSKTETDALLSRLMTSFADLAAAANDLSDVTLTRRSPDTADGQHLFEASCTGLRITLRNT